MNLSRALIPAIFVTTAACGSDAFGPAQAEPLTVGGDWRYVANELKASVFGEDVDCVYRFEMKLTVAGGTFDGTYRDALMTCTLFGESQIVDAGEGDIVGGSLLGNDVQFDVDTEGVRNIGTLAVTGMSGEVSIELIVQRHALIDTIMVRGPWTASR